MPSVVLTRAQNERWSSALFHVHVLVGVYPVMSLSTVLVLAVLYKPQPTIFAYTVPTEVLPSAYFSGVPLSVNAFVN